MRTNIEIDDQLMTEAMRATGLTTKKATVEEGLRRLVRAHRYAKALALRGKVRWEGDLDAMRTDRVGRPDSGAGTVELPAALPGRRARPGR